MKGEFGMLLENTLSAKTTHYAMGTLMTHKAFGPYAEECLSAVCREIGWIEAILSRFVPDSEISRINRSAGVRSEKVSFDTYEVLSRAIEFSELCSGCFDATIAPLVNLWKIDRGSFTEPDETSIRQVLPLVNYRDILLDPWEMTAGLWQPGQSIDLGGIGKGYAADKILKIYEEYGISSAYSNLGANVVSVGNKPDGSPWQVGIQHPRSEDRVIGSVAVTSQTVVTSGDYQRYQIDSEGKRRHHILDPKTGYPTESGLISVSIIADRSVAADALSTILFVTGMEKGLPILRRFPGTEAVLVDSNGQVYVTKGLKYRFQADEGIETIMLD
jgi:FAD:protein FMN transferase